MLLMISSILLFTGSMFVNDKFNVVNYKFDVDNDKFNVVNG